MSTHRDGPRLEDLLAKRLDIPRPELAVLDKALAILIELALDERRQLANGWIGVTMNIQEGVLKNEPRRDIQVSHP